MTEASEVFREAQRRARVLGLAVCLLGPLVLLGLAAGGWIPPGKHPVAGLYQQVGYTFTGLVFLAAAWVSWRKVHLPKRFAALPAEQRPGALLRESLLYSAAFGSSAVWGVLYWLLVGWSGVRHAITFLLLTPVMFLCFMPGPETWNRALKEEVP